MLAVARKCAGWEDVKAHWRMTDIDIQIYSTREEGGVCIFLLSSCRERAMYEVRNSKDNRFWPFWHRGNKPDFIFAASALDAFPFLAHAVSDKRFLKFHLSHPVTDVLGRVLCVAVDLFARVWWLNSRPRVLYRETFATFKCSAHVRIFSPHRIHILMLRHCNSVIYLLTATL